MALMSLLSIIFVFVIGAIKKLKIHIGILALSLTGILGLIAGFKSSELFPLFPTTLFLRLSGTMLLFAVAKNNGCFELLSKKLTAKMRAKICLMPFILFFAGFAAQLGGGHPFASSALLASIGVSLAKEVKANPLLYSVSGVYGCVIGAFLPIGSITLVSLEMSQSSGIEGFTPWSFFLPALLCFLVSISVLYIILKGYKVEGKVSYTSADLPKFSIQNYLTFAGIIILFALTLFGSIDLAFLAVIISIILCLFKCGEGDKILKDLSMSTVMLVCGVGMLLSFCQKVGGFELVSEVLSHIMGKYTAAPIMSLLGSFMSLFATASASTMSLIPTIPGIVANIPEVSAKVLVLSIAIGTTATGISPFSLLGSFINSSINQNYGEEYSTRAFPKQFLIALLSGGVFALLSMVGLHGIFV